MRFLAASALSLLHPLFAQLPPHAVVLNPSGGSFLPLLALSGDVVVAVGRCLQPTASACYARSPDGGRTWPIRETLLGTADRVEHLVAEGDRLFAILRGGYDLWLHRSLNGGLTWSSSFVVSGQLGIGSAIAVSGNTVNIVWKSTAAVWASRSIDAGVTWQPAQRIDPGISSLMGAEPIEIVVDGATLHACWTYWLGGNAPQTGHQRSLDDGVTWLPAAQTLLTTLLAGAVGEGSTQLVAGVASSLLRSVDHGSTWSVVTGHGIPLMEDLAMDGPVVLAVGTIGQLPNLSYLLNVSVDRGATWRPAPYALPTFAYWRTRAHVVGVTMFVHFAPRDSYSGNGIVIESDDRGSSWRVVTNSHVEGLWPSAERCIVTVSNPSNGIVSAYVLVGHTARGMGTTGTGGLEPTFAPVGMPALGHTFSLEVGNAMGASLGMLGVSFAGPGTTPLGSATLWIQMPILVHGFVTSGAPLAAGVGTHVLSVSVPNAPAFAGLSMASQAFVLDPGAVDGFVATRAIESWLH